MKHPSGSTREAADEFMREFGARVRLERLRLNFTANLFAEVVGMQNVLYGQLELGRGRILSFEQAWRISYAINVPLEALCPGKRGPGIIRISGARTT